ncbi:hypothetical protein [Aquamicrobium terrae]|uniref:Outer membrane lipoprotein omp10 n=1 Tax=Aquamicrobium terrae TaxID=1324945 RepID=A0ABV2N0G3_9HYPH
MNIPRKVVTAGMAMVAAGALAACTTSPPPPPGAGGGMRSGVEGSWIDAQGTGLSTFTGGAFQTVATDTGQKLSDGSYRMTGPSSVEITGTSLIRQSPISFNCLMVSTSQLNCTSATGQNFVLTRRA